MNRKEVIKRAGKLFSTDVKNYWKAVLAIAIYILICDLIFGTMCPLAIFTGFPCPGCGITRAAFLLLQFKFAEAFEMHACIYLWVPLAIVFIVRRYFLAKKICLPSYLLIIVGFAMIIYWIWRLVNVYPNAVPMVYRQKNLFMLVKNMVEEIL